MNESISQQTGIVGWFQNAWEQHRKRRRRKALVLQSVEEVVEVADPVIREASKYRKVLQSPVDGAMKYCGTIIDAIPGPVELSRKSYNDDPVVKALFASPDAVEELLRISPEANALREQGHTGETVALLTMTQQEKTIFCSQQQGEICRRDIAQRAMNFTDHQLVAPADNLDTTKKKLIHRGLEVLATQAMEKITALRVERPSCRKRSNTFRRCSRSWAENPICQRCLPRLTRRKCRTSERWRRSLKSSKTNSPRYESRSPPLSIRWVILKKS